MVASHLLSVLTTCLKSVLTVLLVGFLSVLFRQEEKQRKLKGSGLCQHSLSHSSDSMVFYSRARCKKEGECESDTLRIYLMSVKAMFPPTLF